MQYTTNYNLKKPDLTDSVNISDFNSNADIIDSQLADIIGNINLSTNGFKMLPGGLYLEWMTISSATNSMGYSFPLAFPNGVLSIAISPRGNGGAIVSTNYNSKSGGMIYTNGTTDVHIIAIGY